MKETQKKKKKVQVREKLEFISIQPRTDKVCEHAGGPPGWPRTGKEHPPNPFAPDFGVSLRPTEKSASMLWTALRIISLAFNVASKELE